MQKATHIYIKLSDLGQVYTHKTIPTLKSINMFLIYLSFFPAPLLLLYYYLSVCGKNTLHLNIISTLKHFLTAEQSNVQGTVFCVCPKITHSRFWKSERIRH